MNAGGRTNDIDEWRRSIKRSRIRSLYTGSYAPHTRGWWSGAAGKMTRFRGEYFYNNIGFHDIDVHTENANQCLIGAFLGESLFEARQMAVV